MFLSFPSAFTQGEEEEKKIQKTNNPLNLLKSSLNSQYVYRSIFQLLKCHISLGIAIELSFQPLKGHSICCGALPSLLVRVKIQDNNRPLLAIVKSQKPAMTCREHWRHLITLYEYENIPPKKRRKEPSRKPVNAHINSQRKRQCYKYMTW